jgi:hypothetical protein
VVIDCEYRLISLFARSFPTATIRPVKQNTGAPGTPVPDPIAADYHVAAGSLMQYVRSSTAAYPRHNAFLVADPDRTVFWAARLARLGAGTKVGISWRSRSTGGLRGRWYTTLEQWAPIFSLPNVHFVNLQYDDCSAEIAEVRERYGIEIHGWDDIDLMADLDNVAALTSALDLVIGPANAVTAMSGSLGVPTWQFDLPDDYSSLGMAGYLWLPAIRRFTKGHGEPWDDTLAAIGEMLAYVVDRHTRRVG